MKKILKNKLSILIVGTATLMSSCTKNFEEYNTDYSGVTEEQAQFDYNHIGGYFPQMQQMIYSNYNWGWGTNWPFQIMQNLNADIFSGYMMTPTPFAGNINNTNYALVDGWNASAWDYTYWFMMPALKSVEDLTDNDKYLHFNAVAKVLKVLALSRVSAQYGPVIYTHYGESATGGEYDSEPELYNAFFSDLDMADETLKSFVAANPDAKPFARFDNFFGGDYDLWAKFANSLRLRLAMRISKVSPALAQEQAEKAIANGVFTEGEIAQVIAPGYTHPLAAISGSWGDIAMSAEMESILTGYNDPRISKFFANVTDETITNEYKGIRQGIEIDAKGTYGGHSLVNFSPTEPVVLMTSAEVFFLRAEGALNGWNMEGTASSLYESGVNESFSQWGLDASDYLESDLMPAEYVDVKNSTNSVASDSEYMNKVSPKWDDATDDDIKLQKIITQKWIAMFPEGNEAWTEYRRTGYPVLFPLVINNSQGVIDSDNGIKRLNFSVTEKTNNPDGYNEAVNKLGGPDNGATALWWDVD
ncbi:MAG: RagB/SusD family nutrient uptake outer membrane protein [Bacteroidota bacterium]